MNVTVTKDGERIRKYYKIKEVKELEQSNKVEFYDEEGEIAGLLYVGNFGYGNWDYYTEQ